MSLFSKSFIQSIIIIFLLLKINIYKCDIAQNTIEYNYPNCIELNNGNVLIIFEKGIYIFNSELSEEISNINYESGFSLTVNDLDLINLSKFDDGVVISIIKTYIYIFSSTGGYIYHKDLSEDLEGASYYSLIPHKIDGNNYYYIICYMDSSTKLRIYYYYINISDKLNEKKDYLEYSHTDSGYVFYSNNKGVTCQLMSSSNENNVLTCFYEISYPTVISATSFQLGNSIIQDDSIPIIYQTNGQPGYFKSAVTHDRTKALICYSPSGSGGNCIFYNIIDNTFSEDKKYFNSCQNKPKGIHVDYFAKTKEFIFSCSDSGLGLTILKFDEDGTAIDYTEGSIINANYKFNSGYGLFSFSILFLSKYSQYSIIFTTTTSNGENCKHYLLPEEFNPSEVYETTGESNTDELIDKTTFTTSETSKIKETSVQESTTEKNDNESDNINKYKECSTFKNADIKCLYCNEESLELNECIECNSKLGYYPIIYNNKEEKYKECYNEKTKLSNFYFDLESQSFKLCHELCNSCDNGGNGDKNNCTSCISGYILKPDTIPPTNCVYNCKYYFYYSHYDQYRCTDNGQCPKETNLLVRPKNKCVNNCYNDSIYKYQYNSECFKKCPDNTIPNELNICEDENINICTLSIFESDLTLEDIKANNIELSAINYAKEYSYSNNHISQFRNELYTYILFKNSDCIDELSLNFSTIDFGSCYDKIKSYYNITNELIISIMNIKTEGNKPVTLYEVFNPDTGNKINIENICENQKIIIKESLFNYLSSLDKQLISDQNIDIFDLNGSFYTDICYHFDSPIKKDVPLKDRILSFYPNISLCDDGCQYQGVDLKTFKTECQCKITNFVDNYLSINDFLFSDSIIGDAIGLLKESNLLILKCYKDLLDSKYYKNNKGFFIIITLIGIQILCTILFLYRDLFNLKKYIFNLTDDFIKYICQVQNNIKCNPPFKKKVKNFNKKNKLDNKHIVTLNENDYSKTKRAKMLSNDNENYNSTKNMFYKKNINKNKNNILITSKNNILNTNNTNSNIKLKRNSIINFKNKLKINSNNSVKTEENNFKEFLDTSLDDLEYDEAVEKDKRKLYQIFIDKTKDDNMVIRTFFISDNVRPKSIKILLFVFIINLYFVINALMYNEEYISELYYSNENENFFYFLTNSIGRLLSVSAIGIIISYLIEFYFLDEKKLKRIFIRNKKNEEINFQISILIKTMDKKYKSFIITNYLLMIVSLYYIFCFNNVYPNTSSNWIFSTIFLIVLIQLISFVYIFLESILRFISFKCKSETMFKLSKILTD